MFAIYKRELRSYFNSFIGLLFVGVNLFFLGLYYFVYNLLYGYPYYSYVVSSTAFLFLISIPILCMRILTEERHNKTDQLILTAPVSVGGIVMGKFLALTTIFAVPTLISCVYPLILTRYGSVPLGSCYLAILAFFLYGVSCIAICMLVSSITESQVIAAVLSFGVLFLGYMMSSICSVISSTGNLLTKILGYFDLYSPFGELLNGTLNLDAVVYFLSLTVLALFLTVQSIQKRRYSVSVKHLSMGAYSTGMIAVVVAVIAVVNVILGEMPGTWTAIDMTSQKLYSLTDQTKEFIDTLDEDITIYVIVNEDNEDTTLGQTLDRYEDLSDHITVEYVDPTVNPRFHTQYTDSNISMNSLIIVGEKRNKVIDASDIYESTYDYETYTSTTTGYDGEGQITSAIAYVISDDIPKMYITEGHGEYTLSSSFTSGLDKENVEYTTVNLMDYDAVPEDASCLLINAPASDFSSDDKDKVIAYLEKGGNVILVYGYSDTAMSNLDEIVSYMGMTVADGIVVEGDQNYYYSSPYYLLPDVSYSTYTSSVYDSYYIFAPYAKGIQIADEDAEDISYTTFMNTSEDAFSKISLTDANDSKKGEDDVDGPFYIGVEAVKDITTGESTTEATMVIIGSGEFLTDNANVVVSGANQMVFNSIVGNFSEHEVSVSIPVKDYEVSYLVTSQGEAMLIGALAAVILPVGCLVVGFAIWFRRRKR